MQKIKKGGSHSWWRAEDQLDWRVGEGSDRALNSTLRNMGFILQGMGVIDY